jgi:hypothetical protein
MLAVADDDDDDDETGLGDDSGLDDVLDLLKLRTRSMVD